MTEKDNAPLLNTEENAQELASVVDPAPQLPAAVVFQQPPPKSPKLKRITKLNEDVPEFLRDNGFILDGYRVNHTFLSSLHSLFTLHNETVNVWSHFLGFLAFLVGMFVVLGVLDGGTLGDFVVLAVFFIGAQCQMLFSCLNMKTYGALARLDYAGITMMIAGSMYPIAWFGFACQDFWKFFYIACITLFAALSLFVSVLSFFQTQRFLFFRIGFFIAFGLSGVVPLIHLLTLHGAGWLSIATKLIVMGLCYIVGAVIFGSKVPERFFPGKFDFWWSSHQIWHFFTMVAAAAQLWACILAYQFKQEHSC